MRWLCHRFCGFSTLLTEVDVDNPKGRLRPGAYLFVHFKLPESVTSVTVPANTLLFRKEGRQAGVVRDGRVELVSVKIGRDYGNSVEIVSGVTISDSVVFSPPDSLISRFWNVRIQRQQLEDRLLAGLQNHVPRAEFIDYAIARLQAEFR